MEEIVLKNLLPLLRENTIFDLTFELLECASSWKKKCFGAYCDCGLFFRRSSARFYGFAYFFDTTTEFARHRGHLLGRPRTFLRPRIIAVRALIHPHKLLAINFNWNNVGICLFGLGRAFIIWAHNCGQMFECRIILQIRVHRKTSRVLLTENVLVNNRIVGGDRLFVGAFATRQNCGL